MFAFVCRVYVHQSMSFEIMIEFMICYKIQSEINTLPMPVLSEKKDKSTLYQIGQSYCYLEKCSPTTFKFNLKFRLQIRNQEVITELRNQLLQNESELLPSNKYLLERKYNTISRSSADNTHTQTVQCCININIKHKMSGSFPIPIFKYYITLNERIYLRFLF